MSDGMMATKSAAEIAHANERTKGVDGTGHELSKEPERINNERVLTTTIIRGVDGQDREVTEHSSMGLPNIKVLVANHRSEMNMHLNMYHVGGRQLNAKGKEHPVYLQKFQCKFCDEKFNHLIQKLCTKEGQIAYDTHVENEHAEELRKDWLERAGHIRNVVAPMAQEVEEIKAIADKQADEIEVLKAQVEALLTASKETKKGK